ncbi:MAG: LysE family transporter [Alistipes sp.]|nr:LysE family transporter [Alistipes sp.]
MRSTFTTFVLMNIEILTRGMVVGLLASVTLGPVGVMCIQRTLSKSRASGFASGLGAATADSISATLAYFFIAVVASAIEDNMQILKIIGGVFVAAVGVHYFLKNPVVQIRRNRAGKSKLVHDYASTFALTLTNPAFMLWLLVIFSAMGVSPGVGAGVGSGFGPGEALHAAGSAEVSKVGAGAQTILGFFVGAAAWWFTLASVVALFRSRFRPRHLLWINRIAGGVIVALGAGAIISAFV